MGRLATHVAATVANEDNLPPMKDLPNISFLEALLPTSCHASAKKKKNPLDPNVGMRVQREFYDIKKDKNGKKMMVAHKASGSGSKKGEAAAEDVKKNGDAKNDNNGGGNANNQGDKKQGGGGGGQMQNDKEWTAVEDMALRAMKADNKTWQEIGDALCCSKGQAKQRFNQIKGPNDGANPDGAKKNEKEKDKAQNGKNESDKKDQSNKKDEKDHKQPAKGPSKPTSKPPSKAASHSGNGEARFTMGEWRTLQEDDMFSFGELQCLSELILRDDRQRWLRIASAFSDKTGRRVHPDDIREKFEEMGSMG